MKKNLFKTMIALCLTMVMFLSMGASVFALESTDTANIEVDGVTEVGSKVYAYKVIDVNFDYTVGSQQPKDPVYTWNEDVKNWVKSNFPTYIDATTGEVTKTFVELASDKEESGTLVPGTKIRTFVDELANHIRNNSIAAIKETTIDKDNSRNDVVLNAMGLGAYLLLVEEGMKIYTPGFVKVYPDYVGSEWVLAKDTFYIEFKAADVGITKTVEDKTYAIGDKAKYLLTVTVPQYPTNALDKHLVIKDELPGGLTLDYDSVKIYTDAGFKTEANGATKNSLTNGFSYSIDYATLTRGGAISTLYVKYEATVDAEAYDSTNSLKNTAYLIYNENPYTKPASDDYKKLTDDEQIYTYGIEIDKVLYSGTEVMPDQTAVAGTTFNLFTTVDASGTPVSFVEVDPGVYRSVIGTEVGTSDLVVDSNGMLLIKGLDLGTYTLKETKAPKGFALPTGYTTVVLVDENGENPNGEIESGASASRAEGTNVGTVAIDDTVKYQLNVEIKNFNNEFNLPATGGMGTILFTSVGIFVMGAAVVMMVAVLKRGKAR